MSRVYYPQVRAILQVVLDGFGPSAVDTPPLIVPVIPMTATIHRNSYKQADSWELTFEGNDLPLDPRLVRAGAVEIYVFAVPGIDDDQRLISRKETLLADPAFTPRDAIDELALEVGLPSGKDRFTWGNKPMIFGLFDRAALNMDDKGKVVTIAGQDYTAHLASLQWPPTPAGRARRIPVGQRLDRTLEALLAEADPTGRMVIDVRGVPRASLPTVGAGEVRHNRRGIPIEQDTTYWDVMYKLATRYGLILFVDGLDVVLSRPRTISAQAQTQIKRMAWGRNLESLELSRDLGKEQSPDIVVQGYDENGRKGITVGYPGQQDAINAADAAALRTSKHGKTTAKTRTKEHTRVSKKGKVTTTVRKRDEYQIVPAFGITDPAVLRRMAENLYNLLGRAERKVVFRTKDLTDLQEADMIGLVAGDAVTIEWDEFNREMLADPRTTEAAKIEHLVERGYGRAVAQEIATSYGKLESLGINRPLRVREATIEYDGESGISIEAELADFILIDGQRDSNLKPTRASTRASRITDNDGRPVGWTPGQQAANARRSGL